MLSSIYPVISWVVVYALILFVTLLILRMVFSYADPNPFGSVGRFAFWVRKNTERFVYPAARLLAQFRIDPRYAPLITILVACFLAYFSLQIIWNTIFIIEGLTTGIVTGSVKIIIGFVLYAALSIYTLFILIRFISAWFVFSRNTFLGFVQRVTDPVLIPLRRLIPPIGMLDISAMILLLLIGFLESIVLKIFVYS
ncbi:MAG: YggT family protein [Pyrinomonadaceae bacterium]